MSRGDLVPDRGDVGSGAGNSLPAGTTLSVRLTSRDGSHTSRVDEPVTAVLIARYVFPGTS